jgi:small neutral amino acid transporter SnatA (MarC family)
MTQYVLVVFAGFFAIMNPFVNIPIFIGLTEGFKKTRRNRLQSNQL